jgi:very-short-patch-repair endonuclease
MTERHNIELLKTEFREFCVEVLVIRQIDDIFSNAEFVRQELDSYPSGERRSLIMEYYASVDWNQVEVIQRFLKVLESTLLMSFIPEDQKDRLRSLITMAGFEVDSNGFTIYLTPEGVGREVRNLIFAADGLKPEIVLSDSVSNDITIVKNEEFCLVYDRPIHTHGLLWKELVGWWHQLTCPDESIDFFEMEKQLYLRLKKSLSSPPEKLLWRTYFKFFHDELAESLPALIPQIYLHYDPYTIRQLEGERRLVRQRMDFLLFLSDRIRVVIEVDGKQHYSNDDKAEPRLYSEMVAEDRKLKLKGYEVYRFGGYELSHTISEESEEVVKDFFCQLFRKYNVV